jgi:hypothetical protein
LAMPKSKAFSERHCQPPATHRSVFFFVSSEDAESVFS